MSNQYNNISGDESGTFVIKLQHCPEQRKIKFHFDLYCPNSVTNKQVLKQMCVKPDKFALHTKNCRNVLSMQNMTQILQLIVFCCFVPLLVSISLHKCLKIE